MTCWKRTQIVVSCQLKQGAEFPRGQLYQTLCSVSSALWERLDRSQTGELLCYSLVKASNLYCIIHGLYNPWIQISHIPAVHGLTELQQHCQIFGACLHQIPSFKPDRMFLLRLMFRAVIHLSAERLWTHKSHQLQD